MLLVMPFERGGRVVGATGGTTGVITLTASDEDGGTGGRLGATAVSDPSVAITVEDGERSAGADGAAFGNFPNSKRDLRLDGCSINFPTQLLATQRQPHLLKNHFQFGRGDSS